MATSFLRVAAADAVQVFVDAKLAGKSDQDAGAAARTKLTGELYNALDTSLGAWKPLAMPLADLVADGPGSELPLVAASANHTAQTGDWQWALRSDASLKLVADVLDADQLAILQIPPRDGHQVVRYGASGALSAGVSGGSSLGAWSLDAGAQSSVASCIEWYIAAASQKRLGQALVEAIPFLLPPMSLQDQLERAGDFEYWGSAMELKGELGVSFSAEASLTSSGWTWGFDGERTKLGLTLGLSGSASISLGGNFRLRCIVKEAGVKADGTKRYGVEATLERLTTTESSLALALSAGLDATALATSADQFLRSHLPDPDKVDASLQLITNPGTALGDKLRGALESALGESKLKDLVLVTAGFGDQATLAKPLAARVAGPLMDEIDKLDGALDLQADDIDALLGRWLDRAFGSMPVLDEPRDLLKTTLTSQLSAAKAQFDAALNGLSQRLERQTLAAAGQLLAPFASFGDKVQQQLAAVAGQISASQAAQAVKQGFAEYAKLRGDVLKALGDAQRAKITLTLAGSLDTSRSSETFFRGVFVNAPDLSAAERLFQALWSGRLKEFAALVSDARASGALAGEPEGWLMRSFKRVASLSLNISLFGSGILDRVTKTSDLKLQADLVGNVIASGSGGVQADVQNYWTERHARLVLSVQHMARPAGATLTFAINGAYSAKGRDITPEMFNAMQRMLVRVNGGTGTLDIRQLLKGPDGQSMADSAFRRNVALLLPISLLPEEMLAFLNAAPQQLREDMTTYGLRAMDAEYEDAWDTAPSALLSELAKALKGSFATETTHLAAYLDRFPSAWHNNPNSMSNTDYENLGLDIRDAGSGSFGSPMHRKLGTLFRLAKLLRSIVDLQAQCLLLAQALTDVNAANLQQAEAAGAKPLRRITDALEPFSPAALTLIGNDEMVSWPFASFAATMAQACGRAVPPGFVACALLPGQENRPIPLIAA